MKLDEDHFRRLVELSPDAIALQCQDQIVYMNPSGVALFGARSAGDLVGRSIWEFVPKRYKAIVEKRCRQMSEDGLPAPPIEMKLSRTDNQTIDVEVTVIPSSHRGKPAIQAVFHDISARKLVEDQIRQRNIELRALNAIAATVSQSLELDKILDDALEGIVRLDLLGDEAQGMIFLYDEANKTLSLAAHRGAPAGHPCLERNPGLGECLCGLAVQSGDPVISEDCFKDERHTRAWPDMTSHRDVCLPLSVRGMVLGAINVRLPASREIGENVVKLLTSVADQIGVAIENARLFEEVRLQSEQLRTLSGRLAEAEEVERHRIARELHDQVGESLTALGINLGIIRKRSTENEHLELQKVVDDALSLVDKTTERIRGLMSELRPPMLDDYGLVTALRWYGEQFSHRAGIEVVLSGDEPNPRLPARTEIALFRIATEAMTNVAKHAAASNVSIHVAVDEENVRLVVSDDGVGFDAKHPFGEGRERGWGLLTMAERAESVGGTFMIESTVSGGGTRVITEAPR